MIEELICMLFWLKAAAINFQFSSFLFENQVKMCIAINLADPVLTIQLLVAPTNNTAVVEAAVTAVYIHL